MDDDELLEALASTLGDDAPAEPAADRVEMLRRFAAGTAAAPEEPSAGPSVIVDAEQSPRPVADRNDRQPGRLDLGWLAAAAAAVAFLVAGALIGWAVAEDRRHPSSGGELEYAGPITGQEAAGRLEVVKIGIGRVVSLDTFDLPILPTSEYYEIWFVAPDDSPVSPNRISAGTFHPDADGRSEVTFAAAVDPTKYPVVEITAEPGDGDPSPTGPVVMRVQIVDE